MGGSSGAPRPCSSGRRRCPASAASRSSGLRGVRPVLAGGGRRRHPRVDARLRQRVLPVPVRLDRTPEMLPFQPDAVPMHDQGKRPIEDAMAAMRRATALLDPLPRPADRLRSRTAATGSARSSSTSRTTYRKMPQAFDEDPIEAFKRNVYVSPFHEDDIERLIDVVGVEPHPLRLRLPPSRGPGRALLLRRPPARRPVRRGRRQDHGRQPRRDHAGRGRRRGLTPSRHVRPPVAHGEGARGTSRTISARHRRRRWVGRGDGPSPRRDGLWGGHLRPGRRPGRRPRRRAG